MLSYYCLSPSGRDFLYIPYNLFAHTHSRRSDVSFRYDPNTLQRIGLAISSGVLSKFRLEERGWDIHEIDIPDDVVKKFRELCFKKRNSKNSKKILKKAIAIFSKIEEAYESFLENDNLDGKIEITQEGGYREIIPYDDEDFHDDWWMRGDEPPSSLRYDAD